MKLSTKGRYSLQTMVYLATCKENCSIRSISEATGISSGYLEQLMIPLRRAKLVVAERGVQGGYRIARSGITCHDVLSASEGDFHPAPCQDCGRSEACKTHQIWSLLQNAVVDYSKQVYIEDLASHLVEQEVGGGI
ncbi:RrF2 family transcriptional regulator [Sphaerochaeta halotolerans]|jgi:Rrf2 family protein|uniref:Rrf2 family transcriptional regulator n=1 Tax=Sphaerochaeta halotolerans TaxID=2293840 RepID=A0A372MHG2_9SPIR|nr:Rrf2 family transcriptional regulator [Sphaerochaeta halotolerans]MBG0766643.1 Rrf2 family transcriptional regulator [Spirochaetaceae bacterium]MDK2860536.1 Rrf2 family transcriptional regulator, iron-sulfur cluster assembly transcription factor [Sphaerochaeta sp.]MDN5333792.1 Rrf2 family transcriptional regulator, iron-sulfur cluster assembly transcription factor [Sphaerochaeta sp.]MXI85570.1 Rrf2 family transcriptional regulator [Sphaerochaeta halotolerans]RFU95227.1 Rrf2 family transcrip